MTTLTEKIEKAPVPEYGADGWIRKEDVLTLLAEAREELKKSVVSEQHLKDVDSFDLIHSALIFKFIDEILGNPNKEKEKGG